jgi:hypothetical protein
MAAIQPERIFEFVEALSSRIVTAVNEPAIGGE